MKLGVAWGVHHAVHRLKRERELGRIVEEEEKREYFEEKRETLYFWEEKEHLVRRYPGNARSSFWQGENERVASSEETAEF
jgi:hypothetical protein